MGRIAKGRKASFCNLDKSFLLDHDMNGMPAVRAYKGEVPCKFLSFEKSKYVTSRKDKCLHFYCDDYQFERTWNMMERYVSLASSFGCTISPDFSVFLNAPYPVNAWNIYRNRLVAAYYQHRGIDVIYNLPICKPELYDLALDGIEKGGIFAVGTMKIDKTPETRSNFYEFMREVKKRLNPSALIMYGHKITLSSIGNVIYVENENLTKWRGANI